MPPELLLEEAQAEFERQQDSIDRALSPVTDELEQYARQFGVGILQDILTSIEAKLIAEERPGTVIPKQDLFFWSERYDTFADDF